MKSLLLDLSFFVLFVGVDVFMIYSALKFLESGDTLYASIMLGLITFSLKGRK